MKNFTFLFSAKGDNHSDVFCIIAHITEAGLRLLQALEERAAEFTRNWSDSVDSISFELPEGVTVFGIDTGFDDEETLEIGGQRREFSIENLVLSSDDHFAIKSSNRSDSRLLVMSGAPLDANDVCEIATNQTPDWSLCSFLFVINKGEVRFSANFENTDERIHRRVQLKRAQ